jgi:hypothetical protein
MRESGKNNKIFNLCLKHQQPQTTSIVNILHSSCGLSLAHFLLSLYTSSLVSDRNFEQSFAILQPSVELIYRREDANQTL